MHTVNKFAFFWTGVGALALAGAYALIFFVLGAQPGTIVVPITPVEEYQPQRLTWSLATGTAEWQPRDSAASFIFNGKLWTMGGLNGNQDVSSSHVVEYWEAPHFNDAWSTSDGVHWVEEAAHVAWPPRRSMTVVPFNDKLFMFGGWSPIGSYTNDIWQSADGINWEKVVAHAPWTAREGQVVEIFNGKLWMFGGVNYDARQVNNEVWYSEDGLVWKEATTTIPWRGRWDHSVVSFKGKLFLAGGMNLSLESFNDVWVSSDGLNWELVTGAAPWVTRQGHTLVVLKDTMWIVGRLNDQETGGPNDLWFTKDGTIWQKTDTDPPWLGREDHIAIVFNNKIFVFGGMGTDWQWKNDVWVSSN